MPEKKSDIVGVAYLTVLSILALGAGVGFVGGLIQVYNDAPDASIPQMITACIFFLIFVERIIAFFKKRNEITSASPPADGAAGQQ